MKRINVWSSPRNISTAFMYSFAQRPDTTVVDEPLYAHYLSKTNSEANHPGTPEILATMENDGEKVVQQQLLGTYPTEVVLFKQMTHHLVQLEKGFFKQTDHVLLIRDPRQIIASYTKVIPNPSIADIGIKMQWELFEELTQMGRNPAVIDARLLLLQPEKVLKQLCTHLNIPFYPSMLNWPPGPREEDGVWARYWYKSVHQSTGFKPYVEREINLAKELDQLAAICQGYYESLLPHAINGGR